MFLFSFILKGNKKCFFIIVIQFNSILLPSLKRNTDNKKGTGFNFGLKNKNRDLKAIPKNSTDNEQFIKKNLKKKQY